MVRLVPAAITPVEISDIKLATVKALTASNNDLLGQFRSELARYFSGKQAYTFTSFMRATYACLASLKKLHPKRKFVILPRYSCPSFAHAVLASGLTIRYCDMNPDTLSINMDSLNKALGNDVLAVIVSNLFGLSNPIDEICKKCKAKKISVLEGADYGIGSVYKGKKLGSYGDFTILNFQEGKALPIGGGAIVERRGKTMVEWEDAKRKTASATSYLRMAAFSVFSKPLAYGILINTFNLLRLNRKSLSMEDTIRKTKSEFDFEFNKDEYVGALSTFQAALGLIILSRLEKDLATRLGNATKLEKSLRKNQKIKRLPGLNKIHYIRYPIIINSRGRYIKKLAEVGIEASPMYIEHGMTIDKKEFPGAFKISQELLTLPCHPYMQASDIEVIIKILKE